MDPMSRRVVILGSTGSVGIQALEVIAARPGEFEVVALASGGSNPALLAKQAIEHQVKVVAVARATSAQDVQLALYAEAQKRGWAAGEFRLPTLLAGRESASEAARLPADVVLNAITGAVGLGPTLATLETSAVLALANKESLIIGGHLVTSAAAPGQIVPVDSEHSAIAQALRGEDPADISRLIVTASGGPFRGWTREQLLDVTPEQASAHPTWDMGPVITINSATLVNKGLEVIEAHLLFDIPMDRIEVTVHPTSIVHSMVEFVDGSTMLQASPPDMKLPIALGLDWPRRLRGASQPCDWSSPVAWEFAPLDDETFPAVTLARAAGTFARTAPAVYNATNEICVQAFMQGHLTFPGIADTIAQILTEHMADPESQEHEMSIDRVLAADAQARVAAANVIDRHLGVSS